MSAHDKILSSLGLKSVNSGAWSGSSGWSSESGSGALIDAINPATGELIARVRGATAADYDSVMRSAEETFRDWRSVPAPKRGELVRLVGEELRKNKDALGSLVSLENGKIKAEGDGEVQ